MAMDAVWADDTKTIIKVRIYGSVSWDQYHEVCETVFEMMRSVKHRVDVILLPEVDVPPGNPLAHFKRASQRLLSAGNLGCCISIVPLSIPLARVFNGLISRAYGINSKFQYVLTLKEAEDMIAEARTSHISSS